jgi:hypothetical protein
VDAVIGGLEILFGKGDTDHALWLAAVRLDILAFLLCGAVLLAWGLSPRGRPWEHWTARDYAIVTLLTAIAAALRLATEHNLSDLGGIGYSRMLVGYKGHFGTAQLYSLVYARAGRDLEHAVMLNRLASTLTVPLVYAFWRRLLPESRSVATITAALLALHPLHVLFTPTDALPISTTFLAAASYLLLASAVEATSAPAWVRRVAGLGAACGFALLTQVRYENLLLLVPPAFYLIARRHRPLRPLRAGGGAFALLMAIYVVAVLRAGSSFQNPVTSIGARTLLAELLGYPIYAALPLLVGTAATLRSPHAAVRWLAWIPAALVLPLGALSGSSGHHFARTCANQIFLPILVGGYGLALLWDSPRRAARLIAAASLLWAATLPVLYWPNLRERHLETAEHDFLRAALQALPPGIDRVIVPDDERLRRETHSTIEAMVKYRSIALSVGSAVEVIGMSQFLEHPQAVDCSRDNCAVLIGAFCFGLKSYWFADESCTQMLARRGAPIAEEDVLAGSFVDCSIFRGAERQQRCEPLRVSRRLGLYRLAH